MSERDRNWTIATIRAAAKDIHSQARRVDDVRRFFSPDNIATVAAWAAHPEHQAPFVIHMTGDTLRITGNGDRMRLRVGPALLGLRL